MRGYDEGERSEHGQRGEDEAIHRAYAELGRLGGKKGGLARREQMARGEIFKRDDTEEKHGKRPTRDAKG